MFRLVWSLGMQEFTGNALVWIGLALFLLQALLVVMKLIKDSKGTVRATSTAVPFDEIFKALLEKFPGAALGVAAIWLGSNILGWWAA